MKDEKVCKVCKKPFTWRKKWKKDWDKLEQSLKIFKMGRVNPAELSSEEIEAIANPEAVLDSSSENR